MKLLRVLYLSKNNVYKDKILTIDLIIAFSMAKNIHKKDFLDFFRSVILCRNAIGRSSRKKTRNVHGRPNIPTHTYIYIYNTI